MADWPVPTRLCKEVLSALPSARKQPSRLVSKPEITGVKVTAGPVLVGPARTTVVRRASQRSPSPVVTRTWRPVPLPCFAQSAVPPGPRWAAPEVFRYSSMPHRLEATPALGAAPASRGVDETSFLSRPDSPTESQGSSGTSSGSDSEATEAELVTSAKTTGGEIRRPPGASRVEMLGREMEARDGSTSPVRRAQTESTTGAPSGGRGSAPPI
ncbi:unnamed protein product [Effrenium voratum]|nr:unnamed protein product [Effrenium voratum]